MLGVVGASSPAPDNGCRWPSGWGECVVGKDRHLQETEGESVAFHFGKLPVYFGKEELAKTSQEETSLHILTSKSSA